MRLVVERGVPQEERQKLAIGSLTDWDAARVFLEVVRCGSFRSAAERLDLSINGVRRRIDDFERVINSRWPTSQDIYLPSWGRLMLQTLSSWRYTLECYKFPFELIWAQKFVALRKPRWESL